MATDNPAVHTPFLWFRRHGGCRSIASPHLQLTAPPLRRYIPSGGTSGPTNLMVHSSLVFLNVKTGKWPKAETHQRVRLQTRTLLQETRVSSCIYEGYQHTEADEEKPTKRRVEKGFEAHAEQHMS